MLHIPTVQSTIEPFNEKITEFKISIVPKLIIRTYSPSAEYSTSPETISTYPYHLQKFSTIIPNPKPTSHPIHHSHQLSSQSLNLVSRINSLYIFYKPNGP